MGIVQESTAEIAHEILVMSEMFDANANANGHPLPPKPVPLDVAARVYYRERIKTLLKEHSAVMVARYYTDPEIQALAEENSRCVADSLEMARFVRIRLRRCWSLGYVLWGKPPRYSVRKKRC